MVFVGSVKSASFWLSIQSDRECPTVINPHPESDNSYYRTTFTIERGQSSIEKKKKKKRPVPVSQRGRRLLAYSIVSRKQVKGANIGSNSHPFIWVIAF